ncbi:MAG: response regulator transcription factor [Bacteroidota bacterium]
MTEGNRKRIIVADDQPIVRMGLKLLLEQTSDLCIAAQASNPAELFEKIEEQSFDLAILELFLPGKDSLDVLIEIKQRKKDLPVVIYTACLDEQLTIRFMKNGASAFINKRCPPEELVEVMRKVLSGKKHFTLHQMERMSEMFTKPEETGKESVELLTDREFQVMYMMALGLNRVTIAKNLSVSKNTISNHRYNILKKMHWSSNAELVRYALNHGINR